jgi:histidine triad (HIT) family protein
MEQTAYKEKTVQDSVFTKIIKGEIPCHKVYEDDTVLAFLDIHPIQPGHTLVIPKVQVEQFTELDDPTYGHLMDAVLLLAKHMQAVTKCWRVNVRIEGYDVPHAHVHLVPTNNENESYNPQRMDGEPDHAALAEMAAKLQIDRGEA